MIKTYTMKLIKILQLLIVPVVVALLLVRCDDGEDKLTGKNAQGNAFDASDRITGFTAEQTGAGAELGVLGTNLETATHVYMGNDVVAVRDLTSTSFNFTVPTTTQLGMQELLVVFSDGGRAQAFIEVLPLPAINFFDPLAGSEGDTIEVHGRNLDYAVNIMFGETDAVIAGLEPEVAKIIVPAGLASSPITVVTLAGSATSATDFVSCDSDAGNIFCQPVLNATANGGFENGTLGVVGSGGAHGGNWFLAGSGTRATYEIIESPGDVPGLGTKTLKATIITLGANNWDIQVVNDGFVVTEDRRFTYMARVWSDADGRVMRLAGGVSSPSYQDMRNSTNFDLVSGWNDLSVNIQHIPGQQETQIRLQANFSFPENDGATFLFDDFRVVDVGAQIDCATDTTFFTVYPSYDKEDGCP